MHRRTVKSFYRNKNINTEKYEQYKKDEKNKKDKKNIKDFQYIITSTNDFFNDLYKAFNKSLSEYYLEAGSLLNKVLVIYFSFLVFMALMLVGVYCGYFLANKTSGIQLRDVFYGMGVVVVSCLSYLATESGRHNKKHDVKEKNIIDFKKSSLAFFKELESIRREDWSATDYSFVGFSKKELSDENLSKEIKEKLDKIIYSWREVEVSYNSLPIDKGSLNKDIIDLNKKIDKISSSFSVKKNNEELKSLIYSISPKYYRESIFKEIKNSFLI